MQKARGEDEFVHFKDCDYGSHDYPYVKDFLLAERHDSKQGYYKPTKLGIDFSFGKISIPKYIYTYNGKRTGEDNSEMIKITDVEFEQFDLSVMLNEVVPNEEI